ncbi:MAG: orotate phosphoribosyltransferase [Epulopiscium sp. Nele67-Bin001]|nr:MAG: orotate phosphoribosyltransferase [Epulopiscium sp. Nuni2H_MBin001]OON90258.1 MAG: orotate phosphoribosyltransferase [Epulopiscium sp. Nele67-Bin001]
MKKDFIEFMMHSNVLTFGEFVTKSGRNTPYFVNTGKYQTGEQIAKLGEFYAHCINENFSGKDFVLFGPAYKGIPLVVATAIALSTQYGINVKYCFNRKEVKDHGEGGAMVGYKLQDGDNVIIIEDVITAGTAIRECLPVLKQAANINVKGLIISVDRMERGQSDKTAIQEIDEEFGIKTYPIVTVQEIINNTTIDTTIKDKMEAYFEKYCVR